MAFSGKATYDNFSLVGEDVSDILLMMNPTNTPLLDLLGPAPRAAVSIDHQWTEEYLGPDKIINSSAINSATAATGILVNGLGNLLTVGMILEIETATGLQELVQVTSIPGANSILVSRGFNGATQINSLAAGGNLFVVGSAELEGSETTGDLTRARARRRNYCQIIKKPILISGSDRSVSYMPSVGDEYAHQKMLRTIEAAKELEKAVIRGKASGNSIGSSTAYRTMDGLRSWITAINSTVVAASFAADPLLYVNDGLQNAWNAGARDLNVLLVGDQWSRDISGTNAAKLQVMQDDRGVQRIVETVETDFGTLRKVMTPYLPSRHLMGLATGRIFVPNLQGRSFFSEDLAKTGDSFKGHIIGEYTVEIHHPDKMYQLYRA